MLSIVHSTGFERASGRAVHLGTIVLKSGLEPITIRELYAACSAQLEKAFMLCNVRQTRANQCRPIDVKGRIRNVAYAYRHEWQWQAQTTSEGASWVTCCMSCNLSRTVQAHRRCYDRATATLAEFRNLIDACLSGNNDVATAYS